MSKKPLFAVAFWILLIFVTSCFFVPFSVFVRFVQGFSENAAFRQGFERFWRHNAIFFVKGWHATEYAILLRLIAAGLGRRKPGKDSANWKAAFVLTALFAASDEWHQTFVPGRDGNVRDVLIDCAGALTMTFWLRQRSRQAAQAATLKEGHHDF